MDPDLLTTPAAGLLEAMRRREVSPVEVMAARLNRIASVNPAVNAVVTTRAERAMTEARLAEKAYTANRARSLEGLPFTVKDTIETAGIRTTAGSELLVGHVPAMDAPAVRRLRDRGAIILGKTNTPEFAMTFSTGNSLFGTTRNPSNSELTVGGSSGGEAAIIAVGGSPLGLGSDLAGSIRVPASFCGVMGLRPTVGRTPGSGHIPTLAHPLGRLSVIGPMAGAWEDIDLLMGALDPSWRSVRAGQGPSHARSATRIAFFTETEAVPTTVSVKTAIRSTIDDIMARSLGRTEHITGPGVAELFDLWDVIWAASGGAKGLLEGYIAGNEDMLSPQLRKQADASPPPDPERLAAAWRRVAEIRHEVMLFMEQYELIVCPVAAGPPTARAGRWTIDGLELRGARGFAYSYCWSLLGFPALAVPCSHPKNEIAGIQIVAGPGRDEEALRLAARLQT